MKITLIILVICIIAVPVAMLCFRKFHKKDCSATMKLEVKLPGKAVIVYYSQSKVGNTATIAKWIQKQLQCEIIALETLEPYPDSYFQTIKVSYKERKAKTERAIKPVAIPDDCDIIFIGSPIWYGTYAAPVATFLKQNPCAGKTLVPFSTHGGGDAPRFADDLKAACPDAKVLDGFTARGSNQIERRLNVGVTSYHTEDDVIRWLNGLFGSPDGTVAKTGSAVPENYSLGE